jgi:dTDP-4-amino-4,6-dideoxygalactose transaminase
MIPIARPIIGDDEKKAVMEVLSSGMLVQGKRVEELEKRFSEYCQTKYAVAVNSGTAALHTALYALGLGENDTVVTSPFTFVATANSILMQNANVAFADIKPDTFNINPDEIKITSTTKAIISVDLFGQLADYDKINAIADENDLKVVEDAAQAVGAEYNTKRAGSFGDIGIFSLYATKNITAGEGGIITTNSEEFYSQAKRFRNHGQDEGKRYQYHDLGYNYRMSDISAAIAIEQLKKIDTFNDRRKRNAQSMTDSLESVSDIITPYIKPNHKHVFHQYTVLVDTEKRDKVVDYLKTNGIGCAVFYPEPLHLQNHIMKAGFKKGDFPVAEEMSKRVISLPIHPSLSEADLAKIVDTLKGILN